MPLKENLKDTLQATNSILEEILSFFKNSQSNRLLDAVTYSIFSGGKRIRPFLVIASSEIFNVDKKNALYVAASIELIHTYSLIHDDLPCMDDDDIRRGKPTCHIKFDQATALLAGDALQSLAFEILSSEKVNMDSQIRCELIQSIAHSIGIKGMAGGQMMDISIQNNLNEMATLSELQKMKTGELFAISCEAGAILGKASKSVRSSLRQYGLYIGEAFQIIDDIEDFDSEIGSDKTQFGNNFLSVISSDQAYKRAKSLINKAKIALEPIGKQSEILLEFAESILHS